MGDNSVNCTYMNENGYARPHHRVLKPPGGESHDIFGTGGVSHADTSPPRRNTNHLKSNVFAGDTPDSVWQTPQATPKQKYGNGNRSNIFGVGDEENEEEDDENKQRKVKDYLKSNIFGDDNGNEPTPHGTRRAAVASSCSDVSSGRPAAGMSSAGTPATQRMQLRKQGGNPITGEGYSNGSANGDVKDNGQSASRGRNPPGGHSTKLW